MPWLGDFNHPIIYLFWSRRAFFLSALLTRVTSQQEELRPKAKEPFLWIKPTYPLYYVSTCERKETDPNHRYEGELTKQTGQKTNVCIIRALTGRPKGWWNFLGFDLYLHLITPYHHQPPPFLPPLPLKSV